MYMTSNIVINKWHEIYIRIKKNDRFFVTCVVRTVSHVAECG